MRLVVGLNDETLHINDQVHALGKKLEPKSTELNIG